VRIASPVEASSRRWLWSLNLSGKFLESGCKMLLSVAM